MKSRYLVTGFQAFGGDDLNPTELLLKWIDEDPTLSSFFETQLLPVEFDRAHKLILERSDLDSFNGVFCFGLAGGRSKISLERVALNWTEGRQPDNAGHTPAVGVIEETAEKVIFNNIPLLESLRDRFEAAGLPVEISLSAGGYVCNHLYFHLLKASLDVNVLFIHIPYLEEQVKAKAKTKVSTHIEDKNKYIAYVTEKDLRKMLEILMQSLRAD